MVLTKSASTKQSDASIMTSIPTQANNKKKVKNNLTRVVVHCDVGFNNGVFIRGNGANLSWDKGIMLQNIRPDEWVWETDQLFHSCEFKVLINDAKYEQGNNHTLTCKNSVEYTPCFS